jgi:hypothetical protein
LKARLSGLPGRFLRLACLGAVAPQLPHASRYTEVGLTDDERMIGRHVGDFLPHDA